MTSWTRVRTHDKNSGETVRRLGTIIQSIFCAQSGASIRLTVWKWSGESRYPRSLPPVLENFRRAFSPGPTDCPWVSVKKTKALLIATRQKVQHVNQPTLDLFLNGNLLEEAENENSWASGWTLTLL